MAVNDASVVEGNTGTTAKFTVTRSGSTSAAASVSYMTLKETAVSGSDFAMIYMTTLNFAPGETTKTVDVSNGAGKTTTLRTISGLLHPTSGEISFDGGRVDRVPAHRLVARGIAQAPEGRRLFPRMTVKENLDLGAYLRTDGDVGADLERVTDLSPILAERRTQTAGTLSGGEQQMLAIGRALMSRPRLLMLDEPSMGLSPIMMSVIFDTLAELKMQGTTLLLVEQNAQAALKLADRGHVLETGRIVLSGTAVELMQNDDVRKAYLGEE